MKTPRDQLQNYENNLDCTWVLTTSPGKRIVLDPFQINIEKCSSNCTCDYLEIKTSRENTGRHSESNQNSMTKPYCGDEKIPKMQSKDNFLSVHFKSDGATGLKGFKIKYHLK